MRRSAVLCDGGANCPGKASVKLTHGGRCELALENEGESRSFPCSVSALINVGLGARTHLASEYGSCTLSRKPGGVKITMTPWGFGPLQYLVPLDIYAEALARISEARIVQTKVSLR
ncbi:MAG: hypothetical protein QOJ65_2068 [Fimbriimonadaceae bacterium]|nr:hypothetical protein [Fimbriimonadaceae bacterium]